MTGVHASSKVSALESSSSKMLATWRALAMYLWSPSGKCGHSLRKWRESDRPTCLHSGHDLNGLLLWGRGVVCRGFGFVNEVGRKVEVRIDQASSEVWSSSRRESRACENSGLIDANVRERSSVP